MFNKIIGSIAVFGLAYMLTSLALLGLNDDPDLAGIWYGYLILLASGSIYMLKEIWTKW